MADTELNTPGSMKYGGFLDQLIFSFFKNDVFSPPEIKLVDHTRGIILEILVGFCFPTI